MDKYDIISDHRHGLYDVPLHEVLLSFNNDDDAILFVEWFEDHRNDFEAFVDAKQEGDYR